MNFLKNKLTMPALAVVIGATCFSAVALADTATTKTMCNPQKTGTSEVPNRMIPVYTANGWTIGSCNPSPQ